MYTIEIPETIHQFIRIYHRMRIWNDNNQTSMGESCRKLFYFIYMASFALSIAIGALTTEDNDERVYLIVVSVISSVMAYRMWMVLWSENGFLSLLHKIGIHSTNDQNEFIRINKKLDGFMKYLRCYLYANSIGSFFASTVFPIANHHLFVNLALPFDLENSDIGFWTAAAYIVGYFIFGVVSTLITKIIWYLMQSISFEYNILGNRLKHLGTIGRGSPHLKISLASQQQLFSKDLVGAIQTYDKINGMLEEFASYFGRLFLVQVATGSLSICGSVYTLGFSSNENLILNGIYCVVVAYTVFDIFMIMYMGNEIMLSSDELSHFLYESNWIEQTESCKKCIIILMERFKRPQELIVGKLYPLNLLTFTSIVNGAYSMFNILQNFR